MTRNYAHRGASGYYPENTITSFEKAIELGCTGIETDVQMTKDGVLVLIHDEMVNRTTNGAGFVKDYTFSELSKLDASSWFSKEFKGLRIPTLEELIYLTKGTDIMLNIELKTGVIQYNGIEEKVINTLYEHNMQNSIILSSFNHYSMAKCKSISNEIKTGLLYMEGLYQPEKYARTVNADALHPYYYAINKDLIGIIKNADIMINVFTVNDINYMKYFYENGVDGIITNYPDKLKKVMEEK